MNQDKNMPYKLKMELFAYKICIIFQYFVLYLNIVIQHIIRNFKSVDYILQI